MAGVLKKIHPCLKLFRFFTLSFSQKRKGSVTGFGIMAGVSADTVFVLCSGTTVHSKEQQQKSKLFFLGFDY